MNLIPYGGVKCNLYVQSMKRPRPNCWYTTQPVGINKLRKTVWSLLKNAGLDGFFTNHSLRRTCATRLFQAGQSIKLVKEITGHISDAVYKYQETSDEQRMHLSKIIQGTGPKLSESDPMEIVEAPKTESVEEKFIMKKLELPIW